jgi:hypothetical protein
MTILFSSIVKLSFSTILNGQSCMMSVDHMIVDSDNLQNNFVAVHFSFVWPNKMVSTDSAEINRGFI